MKSRTNNSLCKTTNSDRRTVTFLIELEAFYRGPNATFQEFSKRNLNDFDLTIMSIQAVITNQIVATMKF